jgi:hypothetical protein
MLYLLVITGYHDWDHRLQIKPGDPLILPGLVAVGEVAVLGGFNGNRLRFEVGLVRTRQPARATKCLSRDQSKVFEQGGIQLER